MAVSGACATKTEMRKKLETTSPHAPPATTTGRSDLTATRPAPHPAPAQHPVPVQFAWPATANPVAPSLWRRRAPALFCPPGPPSIYCRSTAPSTLLFNPSHYCHCTIPLPVYLTSRQFCVLATLCPLGICSVCFARGRLPREDRHIAVSQCTSLASACGLTFICPRSPVYYQRTDQPP